MYLYIVSEKTDGKNYCQELQAMGPTNAVTSSKVTNSNLESTENLTCDPYTDQSTITKMNKANSLNGSASTMSPDQVNPINTDKVSELKSTMPMHLSNIDKVSELKRTMPLSNKDKVSELKSTMSKPMSMLRDDNTLAHAVSSVVESSKSLSTIKKMQQESMLPSLQACSDPSATTANIDKILNIFTDETSKDKKSVTCKSCHKTIFRKYLKHHVSECHGECLPHPCEMCGRGYYTAMGLMFHMKVHYGEAFACHICDSQFSQVGTLRRHMNNIHKMIQCKKCNSYLKHGEDFNEHNSNCI